MRALVLLATLFTIAACSSTPRLPDTCKAKPSSGQCPSTLMRFYFDDRTGVCKGFI